MAIFTLPGKVYVLGAGPGSAKLLTVRAWEVLQTADLVLHDDLVSPEVLGVIPSRTAVFNVGKRCGTKRVTQDEIHRRMISAARKGQLVARLKGGDPLIFGRAQEEIVALRAAGIDFEIVPGITAATAAAAAAQIPLTERHNSPRLLLASNHSCGGQPRRRWHKDAVADSTLVFYMPGEDLTALTEELADAGLHRDTPCLIVSQATKPEQRIVRTALRSLASLPVLPQPSLLIVGEAVREANAPDWVGNGNTDQSADASEEECVIPLGESDQIFATD